MNSITQNRPHLTIYTPYYDNGGVERMLVNLANGISTHDIHVDFIVCDKNKPYLNLLDTNVNLIEFKSTVHTILVKQTADYLCQRKPNTVLCAKESNIALALKAKKLSGVNSKIVFRAGTNSNRKLADKNILARWWRKRALRRMLQQADSVIAVSQGVADDVRHIAHLSHDKIYTANNPVLTPELFAMADMPLNHPWFIPGAPPVILGVGRLSRAKNFTLLIKAFAGARKIHPCHLLILGEGRQREKLETLCKSLGVSDDVMLPGFIENPYPYLRHASLFVLSSNWEGSPNVLTEALALGTPVVATDCPNGPREILQDGKFGALVALDNRDALASAITQTLDNPLNTEILQSAASQFTIETSARQYIEAMAL